MAITGPGLGLRFRGSFQTPSASSICQANSLHWYVPLCGQLCHLRGHLCHLCGNTCHFCGNTCHFCGKACHLWGMSCHFAACYAIFLHVMPFFQKIDRRRARGSIFRGVFDVCGCRCGSSEFGYLGLAMGYIGWAVACIGLALACIGMAIGRCLLTSVTM